MIVSINEVSTVVHQNPIIASIMSDHWKIEDRGPTSDGAALEAMTFRCDSEFCHAPRQFVCTDERTGRVVTVIANDRLEALAKARREVKAVEAL